MTDQQTKEMLETTLGTEIDKMAQEVLEPQGSVTIPEAQPITDAEWCFQFFNNEPVVFGYQNEGSESLPLTLQILANKGESLNFKQNGMEFKIFPRPISEETKKERENESKNKEA
jgi:hypothetical protein